MGPRALLMDPVVFDGEMYGDGISATCASAARVFGDALAYVGTANTLPVGSWHRMRLLDRDVWFFPVIEHKTLKASRISANVSFARALANHSGQIESFGLSSVITGTYTVLWLLNIWPRRWNTCFYYPGLANPLVVGRKQSLGRLLAQTYERVQARALNNCQIAFAAASQTAIDEYNSRIRRFGSHVAVKQLSTSVDTSLFYPGVAPDGRREENLPSDVPLFAFIGRLAKVKGLSFLLDAFAIVQSERPDALLLIIGGGEEERRLRLECAQKNLNASVLFYGPLPPARVASLLRAADVCVVTSLEEGFSAAMLEEVASGKPIVSTAVSGAGELIVEGKNGFVVDSRDERLFAKRMLEALNLPDASTVSRDIALRYADRTVWKTVAEAWAPLKGVIADD